MKGDNGNVQKSAKDRSFHRIVKALSPLPYLGKARDYYVTSLNKLASSATSARMDDEYGELVRAASQRRSSNSSSNSRLGIYKLASAEQAFARSRSVAPSVCTIYEDEPYDFPATLPMSLSVATSRYTRSSTPYNFHPK
ncbi:hypothetical protein SUGI_0559390 [Cryptomeria japonica]|nr:hypothetical protein SUGI_0559280 [Cryptomeria japonica]GLJ28432.1 hypothetical protein SUGI_0559390 [Cryptomeria japonica]